MNGSRTEQPDLKTSSICQPACNATENRMKNTTLPKVIATSVIRSVSHGESHGGVYIVDLATDAIDQVIDWNTTSINWEGRGLDRGLRGIAFYGDNIYIAASDEIFVFDQNFTIVKSFKNDYLRHCHEISIAGDTLYLSSTGFDSILLFDLNQEQFTRGYCVRPSATTRMIELTMYNPQQPGGPTPADTIHINMVTHVGQKIVFCGTKLQNLAFIADGKLYAGPPVPDGTHNACLRNGRIFLNHTQGDCVAYMDLQGKILRSAPVPHYDESTLLMANIPKDHARQGFGRGLCVADNLVIGGSSPSTISVYDLEAQRIIKSLNLTMDVRNSIHGLEIWPY